MIFSLFGLVMASSTAARAGTNQGTAHTVIQGAITLASTAPLDFGILAAGAGGSATINAQTGALTP